MASTNVDHEKARTLLEAAWSKVDDGTIVAPEEFVQHLEEIIGSSHVSFKYMLITGLLAKCTDKAVHPRALQAKSKLPGAYDARGLCHDVVVGFEKTKGNLWGLSNEPLLSKPARHPEHDMSNPQLQNKVLAGRLHYTLEYALHAGEEEVSALLTHALRLSKARAARQVTVSSDVEMSYGKAVSFVRKFLEESDGGARLAAIVGAYVKLSNEGYDVSVYPPSSADMFAGTAGDIELSADDQVMSGYECKQRPITLDDVRHGLRKAREAGVSEYWFVFTEGYASGQEESIKLEVLGTNDLDVHLVDMNAEVQGWTAMLNPIRRAKFGETVVEILRKEMKRTEIANKAAELWNSL